MGWPRFKNAAKACGRWVRWLLAWALFFIGLAGVPNNINIWTRLIDQVMNDPLVQSLTTEAVAIANFVNQFWVRILLVFIGVAILGWGWRPFWRLRHRVIFWGKRALNKEVWISRDRAIDAIRRSRWALSRRHRADKPKSFFSMTSLSSTDPERQELDQMFYNWCGLVLKQFSELHEEATRKEDKSSNNMTKSSYLDGLIRDMRLILPPNLDLHTRFLRSHLGAAPWITRSRPAAAC
jgi:hypothetical protein